MLCISLVCRSQAHASNFEISPFMCGTLKCVDRRPKEETKTKKDLFAEKLKYHKSEAHKYYELAENSCTIFPNVSDQEKASYCFRAAMAALTPTTPGFRIFAMVTSFAIDYGLDMINEWNRIQYYLHEGEFHAQMCNFYFEMYQMEEK